mmetsp:Transcript_7176/g.23553  ORF Transcript_7176/g.23553 Transcript_7176/m.23553 type:complete len:229 (-) Transcript_7176:1644-2330(-)
MAPPEVRLRDDLRPRRGAVLPSQGVRRQERAADGVVVVVVEEGPRPGVLLPAAPPQGRVDVVPRRQGEGEVVGSRMAESRQPRRTEAQARRHERGRPGVRLLAGPRGKAPLRGVLLAELRERPRRTPRGLGASGGHRRRLFVAGQPESSLRRRHPRRRGCCRPPGVDDLPHGQGPAGRRRLGRESRRRLFQRRPGRQRGRDVVDEQQQRRSRRQREGPLLRRERRRRP